MLLFLSLILLDFVFFPKCVLPDLNKCVSYKMEVVRDSIALNKPLFRVTSEEGEQVSCN